MKHIPVLVPRDLGGQLIITAVVRMVASLTFVRKMTVILMLHATVSKQRTLVDVLTAGKHKIRAKARMDAYQILVEIIVVIVMQNAILLDRLIIVDADQVGFKEMEERAAGVAIDTTSSTVVLFD